MKNIPKIVCLLLLLILTNCSNARFDSEIPEHNNFSCVAGGKLFSNLGTAYDRLAEKHPSDLPLAESLYQDNVSDQNQSFTNNIAHSEDSCSMQFKILSF